MTLTSNSSATSYLSASEYVGRYVDPRWVSQKLSKDGNGVGMNPDGSVNLSALAADATLGEALMAASGMVEAAATKSARYDPTDLAALTGVGLRFLKRLVADLTTGILLHDLRPEPGVPLTPTYLKALDWLELLASGEAIFSFVESQQAGLIDDRTDTYATVENRFGLVVDTRRFFGLRNNQRSRGGE